MKNFTKYLLLFFAALMVTGCTQQAPVSQQPQRVSTTAGVTIVDNGALTQQGNQQTVVMLNYVFDPATITIKAGTTVIWVNNDSVPHKIVSGSSASDTNPSLFSSDNLAQGESYSYTFATVGTFDYFCQIHPLMKGKVVVTP